MSDLKEKALRFRALHVPGQPLVLFNIWDAGSARTVAAAGAQAIATGSWSMAKANGFDDGENVPFALVIENLQRITRSVDLPVTIDLERGYGETGDAVAASVRSTIEAGAIGCNIEDSLPAGSDLRAIGEQAARIAAARKAAGKLELPYFINARTDVFFRGPAAGSYETLVAEALERARAYAEAGADCLFVPGLTDRESIADLVARSPLPINIMAVEQTPPLPDLGKAGVARVSHGAGPYLGMTTALERAARAALSGPG